MTLKISILTALVLPTVAFAQAVPDAPASVNTNAEKAAWEALMSPVGEYAATAQYSAVLQKFGQVEPYATILRTEYNHANALTRQLQRYGVAVPANPYLGQRPAPATLTEAAQAWAAGEVKNVALYDGLMGLATGDAQLQRVFTNLQRVSRDVHLPLFTQAAAANGTLSDAQMTTFYNQHMNSFGQGQGQPLGRNQNRPGLNRRHGVGLGAQLNQGYGRGPGQFNRGYGSGYNQNGGHGMQQVWNQSNCPLWPNQGGPNQNFGPGWRR